MTEQLKLGVSQQQSNLGVLDSIQWVGEREAQYLNWKHAVHNNLPFEGKIYDKHRRWSDKDVYSPGVYIYGLKTCGFFTPPAVEAWINGITNPLNISVGVGFGVLTAKSSSPKDMTKSILGELIMMFVVYTVLMLLVVCVAFVWDLLVMGPLMLYRMHQYTQWKNNPSPDAFQQKWLEVGRNNFPFIEREKLEFKNSSL